MQQDLIVVILYDSICNQYKIVKMWNCKYHKIISIENNFVFIIVVGGCMVACSVIYLWPDDGLVTEAETCCHLK